MAQGRPLLLVVLLLVSACGGSPTSPTGLDISGNWTGTWQFVTSGVTVSDSVIVNFVQLNSVAGTWSAASGASGRFDFAVAESFEGTFTISQVSVSGATCSATGVLSGTVSASAIALAVPRLPSSRNCQWATDHQFSLHR